MKAGDIVPFARWQSENKKYDNERERSRAARRRKQDYKESSLNYYSTIGDWSPDDELPDEDEVREDTLARNELYVAFCAGWKSHREKTIALIRAYSENWRPNGPPKAAADAIIKKLDDIPMPIPEGER